MATLQTLSPVQSSLYKYADDLALLYAHTAVDDDASKCSSEIIHILNWCSNSGITMNNKKTQRILISKNNFTPPTDCFYSIKLNDEPVKILGIYFDSNLNWTSHIDYVIGKASRYLHLLRILKPVLTKAHLITLHKAFIQSQLDYGSAVYVGSLKEADRIRLLKTVKRSHRIICGLQCSLNCLDNPDDRRQQLAQKLFQEALSNEEHILHDRTPNILPSGRRLDVLPSISSRRLNSFFPYMSRTFNFD